MKYCVWNLSDVILCIISCMTLKKKYVEKHPKKSTMLFLINKPFFVADSVHKSTYL